MNPTHWPVLRDVLLFVGGLGGVAHETIISAAERPTLLILFAAMMGLPAFLQKTDRDDGGQPGQIPPSTQPSATAGSDGTS